MLKRLFPDRHLLAPLTIFRQTGLEPLLRTLRIGAMDLGARGGFDTLLLPAAEAVEFTGFEPDTAEVDRLEDAAAGSSPWAAIRYLPVAVAGTAGSRKLHLTRSPGCSSLLEPDPRVYTRYGKAELFEVERVVDVSAVTLDHAVQSNDGVEPSYLKLDIQGAEFEVLQGARAILDRSVLAMRIEVEFQPIYQGQGVFRDVDALLSEAGFVLAGFHHPIEWVPRTETGENPAAMKNTRGDLAHADAIYFKGLGSFRDRSPPDIDRCLRAAILAICYGRVGYANHVLSKPSVAQHLLESFGIPISKAMADVARGVAAHYRRKARYDLARSLLQRAKA